MRIPDALRKPRTIVEIFIIGNLAFLAIDVYVAHLTNAFERRPEWLPVIFSIAAPILIMINNRWLGWLAGCASLLVGVGGMLYHLQSHFFAEQTIRNLVYTAPFVAPLAYAGLGMLLILDRMVGPNTIEWAQWILFLALGGFAGNLALSLADHAQNGFFNRGEWIPVVSAAIACAFLLMLVLRPLDRVLWRWTAWTMALQVLVGTIGFALHLQANLLRSAPNVLDRFLYGAPIFAPLLFANLAILAGIGLWALRSPSSRA
ncbi:MAG TPA: hypothetical protein VJ901_16150 [Thermoanaerobaculia bacterium]|nr:hypothetical protein [Thermoanaerobaculia bacterium]